MKHYGIEIPEGTEVKNITVPSGTSFPGTPNVGELFYLTAGEVGLYVHTGSVWVSAGTGGTTEGVPTSVTTDLFNGNGTTTQFTLSKAPSTDNEILVFITGLRQEVSGYSVSGTTLTFTEAPLNGTTIEVVHLPMSITGKTLEQTSFTATEGQTTFTVDYNVGYVLVFLNGVRLVSGTDFTATNGTSVVLTEGATAGDVLEVVNFGVFAAANHYTKAESDAAYASITRSRKNYLINGNFDIWQRGTSSTASGYKTADRWYVAAGGGTMTFSRQAFAAGQTDVPNNPTYFARHNQTAGGTDPYMVQHIENVFTLAGQTVTVSFYAKAASAFTTGNLYFAQRFGTGGSTSVYTSLGTISVGTGWQKYTLTATLPSIAGKTIGSNNTMSFYIFFPSSTTFTFDIAQVQVEEGSEATNFEYRSVGEELALCQRYFEKSYNQGDAPGTISNQGVAVLRICTTSTNQALTRIEFAAVKRILPTVVVYSPNSGATASIYNVTTAADVNGDSGYVGESGAGFISTSGTKNDGNFLIWHWTADAEL